MGGPQLCLFLSVSLCFPATMRQLNLPRHILVAQICCPDTGPKAKESSSHRQCRGHGGMLGIRSLPPPWGFWRLNSGHFLLGAGELAQLVSAFAALPQNLRQILSIDLGQHRDLPASCAHNPAQRQLGHLHFPCIMDSVTGMAKSSTCPPSHPANCLRWIKRPIRPFACPKSF